MREQFKIHKSKSLEPRLLWSSSATCRVEKIFPLLLNAESKAGSTSYPASGAGGDGFAPKSINMSNKDNLKTYRKSKLREELIKHASMLNLTAQQGPLSILYSIKQN